MRVLTRTLAGLILVGAMTFGLASQSAGGVGGAPAASCKVPDYLATHSPGKQTAEGYYEYQAWIANPAAQAALDRVQSLLDSYFGLNQDSGDSDALRAGLVGIALDHAAQIVDVVVDPTSVDVGDLTRRANALVGADPATNRPLFRVVVKGGCSSAGALAQARAFLDGLGLGVAPHGWGFYLDAHDSTYHVTISPRDVSATAVVSSGLGSRATIDFQEVSLLDRFNDGQPHWGGSGIRPGSYSSNICTSAFTIVFSGSRGSVTAGHCFAADGAINGRNVFSGSQDYGGQTAGASDYPNYDMVRIGNGGQSWDNKIHVDPCCPTVRTVTSSGNPSVGDFICDSGMTTLAICGLEVHAIDQTLCLSDGCRLHLIRADRNGDIVARGGDSGGPQYNRIGDTNAAARGMIVAGGGCDASQRCTTVYGHRISAVTGHLNVTVATT
jgi:hypothetical protein